MTDWSIKAREFVHCNCAYGCPCQFNALPTHGHCQAVAGFVIDRGVHGETRLDGLAAAMILKWPGPIHEGRGEALAVIDERADAAQRDALLRIVTGQDTAPGATIFAVFATTFEKVHDPVYAPIELTVDVDARTARLKVPGLIEGRGEPVVNPVTGEEHRARINLPDGFEYEVCEVGRGWSESQAPLALSLADSHAQFAELTMNQDGVVH
jgi:hypothetical protein